MKNKMLVPIVIMAVLILGLGLTAGIVYNRFLKNRADDEINKTLSDADKDTETRPEDFNDLGDVTSDGSEEDAEIDSLINELDKSINQTDPSADFQGFSETDAGIN